MSGMSVTLEWRDLALRLGLTVIVGIIIGYNRSEYGKAAGMRTTLMVGIAACVAMIQVNLLLATNGRPPDSYMMNDSMRLPLGILTGVGFIGAGAILRRGNMVIGVTTAATLWLMTVIGLCFGGGQIVLGLAASGLAVFALWVLKWIENLLRYEFSARLSLSLDAQGIGEKDIRRRLTEAGFFIVGSRVTLHKAESRRDFVFELREVRKSVSTETPPAILRFADDPGVLNLHWDMVD